MGLLTCTLEYRNAYNDYHSQRNVSLAEIGHSDNSEPPKQGQLHGKCRVMISGSHFMCQECIHIYIPNTLGCVSQPWTIIHAHFDASEHCVGSDRHFNIPLTRRDQNDRSRRLSSFFTSSGGRLVVHEFPE